MSDSARSDQAEAEGPDASMGGAPDGPGRLIRAARERAGLSVGDLATQIRLTLATLRALERDDFATLKESVYVRGYYRKCAKALKISEGELIAAYDRLALPKVETAAVQSKLLLSGGEHDRGFPQLAIGRWVIGAVLVIAGIAVTTLIFRHDGGRTAPSEAVAAKPAPTAASTVAATDSAITPTPAPVATPLPATTAPSAPAPSTATPSTDSSQSPDIPAPKPTATATTQASMAPSPEHIESSSPSAAAPVPVEAAAVSSPAASDLQTGSGNTLVLDFNRHSWAKVVDSAGKTLLLGMVRDGARVSLSGRPPYAVLLGDARAVDVTYGGRHLGIGGYVQADNTARFEIPN